MTIVVRPEDVVIAAEGGPNHGLPATVESVAFAGDTLRVQVVTDSGVPDRRQAAQGNRRATVRGLTGRGLVARRDATFVPASERRGRMSRFGRQSTFAALVLSSAVLVVLAGCAAPVADSTLSPRRSSRSSSSTRAAAPTATQSRRRTYSRSRADTGIDVTYDDDCDAQTTQLAAQSEAGQVQWDVIGGFGGPLYADLHNRGLLKTIDHEALGSAAMNLTDGAIQPYGLGFHNDAVVVGYSAEAFPDGIAGVETFYDPEGHPGTRAMSIGGFEDWTRPSLALVADGVAAG